VAIENAHGKTDTAGVAIRALESLRILAINNRSISFLNEETIHPGQEISIVGSGFLVENTVWFGTTSVLTQEQQHNACLGQAGRCYTKRRRSGCHGLCREL